MVLPAIETDTIPGGSTAAHFLRGTKSREETKKNNRSNTEKRRGVVRKPVSRKRWRCRRVHNFDANGCWRASFLFVVAAAFVLFDNATRIPHALALAPAPALPGFENNFDIDIDIDLYIDHRVEAAAERSDAKAKTNANANANAKERTEEVKHNAHHSGHDNRRKAASIVSAPSNILLTVPRPQDEQPLLYNAKEADFGHSIDHSRFLYYRAVIAKVSSDFKHLCEIPDYIGTDPNNNNNNNINRNFPEVPVALLVSLGAGDCDVLTKATNALKIQQEITKELKYVIFYNNNPNNPEAVPTLSLGGSTSRKLAPVTRSPTTSPNVRETHPPTEGLSSFGTFGPTPWTSPSISSSSSSSTSSNSPSNSSAHDPDDDWFTNGDNNQTQIDGEFDMDFGNDGSDALTEGIDNDLILDVGFQNEEENDDGINEYLLRQEQERQSKENRQNLIDNDSIVFVSLSTSAGVKILSGIDEAAKANTFSTNGRIANPEFLQPGFGDWIMVMKLERVFDDEYDDRNHDHDYDDDDVDDGDIDLGTRHPDSFSDKSSGSYSDNAPSTFTVLKFVLFGLLILSPCLRAFHLFWAGGGRIRFRHSDDERNRIVGLQYIPPMDNWFGAYEPAEKERIHGRLTQEEVLSLPEITYQKQCFDDECDENKAKNEDDEKHVYNENDGRSEYSEGVSPVNADDSDAMNNSDSATLLTNTSSSSMDWHAREGEKSNAISYPSEAEPFSLPPLPTSPERVMSIPSLSANSNADADATSLLQSPLASPSSSSSSSSSVGSKEEVPPDEERPSDALVSIRTQRRLRAFTTTTCTMCSICIDEFEEGETIRLLPRCGHAFHTECILPWLKDRQGCCPMCKTGVLEDDGDNGDNNGNGNGNDANNT